MADNDSRDPAGRAGAGTETVPDADVRTDLDALTRAWARDIVTDIAPDEAPLFDALAAEPLPGKRSREESLGFGLDLALLTPYVVAAAPVVVGYLGTLLRDALGDAVKKTASDAVTARLRALLGRSPDVEPLDGEQLRAVGAAARDAAQRLGLDPTSAGLFADAVVSRLAVPDGLPR